MKHFLLILIGLGLLTFTGCYAIEDAEDVNQERISTSYSTVFNATRGTTQTQIDFRFGQTPLRVNDPIYFDQFRLYEEEDFIFGLHYARQILNVTDGWYEWTDANGISYSNLVEVYGFDLTDPPTQLSKTTSYNLAWEGDLIPYGSGHFSITLTSHVDGTTCTFGGNEWIEILPEHLELIPVGDAHMKISRCHAEPIDEGTQAGGESMVSFVREYEISIVR